MRTVPIVSLDEGGQGLGPARLALPRPAVLPLLRERPVHPLDLAVLPGAVGARVEVADPLGRQEGVELAAVVPRAVVGHHALDRDPEPREEGEAAGHERRAGALPLVGQELGVGDAGEVVDGHVQARGAEPGVPPGRVVAPPQGPPAAARRYPRHLLDVHVHELARARPLVAHGRDGTPAPDLPGHAVDVGEPRQPRAGDDPRAGAGRNARDGGEGERGQEHGTPGPDDARLGLGRRGPREPAGPAGPVRHRLAPAGAGEPLARGLAADAHLAGDGRDALPGDDPGDERLPAPGR